MGITSSIFDCRVMHSRFFPKKNSFNYDLYTFAIDLDEVSNLQKRLKFFSYQRWNLFSLYKEDHLNFGMKSIKENVLFTLKQEGLDTEIDKIVLITHLRILGYTFNPVCFYYCYKSNGELVHVLIEVHNTFGELKPFILSKNDSSDGFLKKRVKKYFYVSPFEKLDTEFEFKVWELGENLKVEIDDYRDDEKIFISSYRGVRKELTDKNLLRYFFIYPFMTIKVILLIHIQALKIYLKKVPFIKKDQNQELQKGVYLGKNYS
ncbi:MAG: DUF1365 domain-containing protein [Leptospiraceae bacterium]|nr:DUF1365 domain-containing protein [Leptospiraceae bacterium]